MSILRKLLKLFKRDDLYVPEHEDPSLKREMQNRLYITPKTRIGSLPTVKRELRKSKMTNETEQEH